MKPCGTPQGFFFMPFSAVLFYAHAGYHFCRMIQISIDDALLRIQEAAHEGRNFKLKFVAMDGSIRTYQTARYGGPEREQPEKLTVNGATGVATRAKRVVSLHRDDGTIPITKEGELYRSPKWFSILELDDCKVI